MASSCHGRFNEVVAMIAPVSRLTAWRGGGFGEVGDG